MYGLDEGAIPPCKFPKSDEAPIALGTSSELPYHSN